MANHSFNFVVSFSINDWKENVEILNNSSVWEETQSFICLCQLTMKEKAFFCQFLQMLSTASGYNRGELCLSAVFFAMLTCWHVQFLKLFALLFFSLNLLLFLLKIGLVMKSRVHKTVKQSALVFLCSGKNIALSVWKSTTVNHFTINHAV